ncbi:ENTH domain containing protein [Acanthamoeba castellanii str. Neff]|uniref:ENTH domain containing protein n=1 Tax=Acanthamoeba castellanii (strain ATCC 30010 / Neff) TaxID=1257118 RepID=L8GQA8_ACACF|nr:ENTH domain containing protein [Acanthamoeba castellanii str. Neff]ELR15369.1 ENTH domain containing protein [Acanthamoeba castellanii str. Neff]
MQSLAQASFSYADLPIVMNTLWRRMADTGKDWRHVYKSMIVLDFLIKHGSEQAIREMRYHIVDLQNLTSFQYMDENYQDVGQSVRERAKKVLELLHDERRMKEERDKAQKNRNKYQGYGSDSSMRGDGNDYDDRPSYGGSRGGYDDGDSYRSRESPYGGRRESSPYGDRRESESPYGGRREGGGGSGAYRSRASELSDSDSDSDLELPASTRTSARPPAAGGGGGSSVPRKPSVDNGATFDPFGELASTHATGGSSTSSPFFPSEPASLFPTSPGPAVGNGSSSSSVLPPNLFDTPVTTSTPPPAGMGAPLGAHLSGPSLFPPTGGSGTLPLSSSGTAPPRGAAQGQGSVEAEWDAFVGFDDPRKAKEENQNDIWNKHKNLFDLQHLSLSEKEAAAAAAGGAQQKRPMATMTSAGRGRGSPMGGAAAPVSPKPAAGPTLTPLSPGMTPMGAVGMTPAYPGMVATPYGMPYGGAAMMHPGMVASVGYAPGVPGMVPMGYVAVHR